MLSARSLCAVELISRGKKRPQETLGSFPAIVDWRSDKVIRSFARLLRNRKKESVYAFTDVPGAEKISCGTHDSFSLLATTTRSSPLATAPTSNNLYYKSSRGRKSRAVSRWGWAIPADGCQWRFVLERDGKTCDRTNGGNAESPKNPWHRLLIS